MTCNPVRRGVPSPRIAGLSALTLALLAAAPSASFAQSPEWRGIETAASDGVWAMREQGDIFSDGPYSFYARAEHEGATLEFGCHDRRQLVLFFTPPAGTVTPTLVTSQYAVNGAPAGSKTHTGGANTTRLITGHPSENPGPVADFLEAMAEAWTGEITVTLHEGWSQPPTGPAVFTSSFSFDEDELGGVSEMVLAACGLR